jgi:geranylgeranyl diphosphate synthase type II
MDAIIGQEAQLSYLRDAVDRRLGELVPGPSGPARRLSTAMHYALLAPGKRVRPLLTLLCASQLGADAEAALEPACAVEMVHAASLVLDDLPCMDDAQVRRGRPATHIRFGEDVAVLAGVALLNQAFVVLSRARGFPARTKVEMVRVLSDAVGLDGLVAGQDGDLSRENDASLARLSDIHHRKTGVLFMAAAELGALAAGAGDREIRTLNAFAAELGLAFQALDDIADGAPPHGDADRDEAHASAVAILGHEGAHCEAERRIRAAAEALKRGGRTLEPLARYIDVILGLAAPSPVEAGRARL